MKNLVSLTVEQQTLLEQLLISEIDFAQLELHEGNIQIDLVHIVQEQIEKYQEILNALQF